MDRAPGDQNEDSCCLRLCICICIGICMCICISCTAQARVNVSASVSQFWVQIEAASIVFFWAVPRRYVNHQINSCGGGLLYFSCLLPFFSLCVAFFFFGEWGAWPTPNSQATWCCCLSLVVISFEKEHKMHKNWQFQFVVCFANRRSTL